MDWRSSIKRLIPIIFYGCLFFAITSVLILFCFKEENLIVKIHLKAPNCSSAYLFYRTHRDTLFNSLHHTKVSLAGNDLPNIYEIKIPSSINFFRFDPCEDFYDTEITSFEIIGGNKTEIITKEIIKEWKCKNCIFEDINSALRIKALNNNPIIWNSQFDKQIKKFNSPKIDFMVKITDYIFFVCIAMPFLMYLAIKINKTLTLALSIYVVAVTIIIINFEKIKDFFSPAKIHSQKIVGNVHYFGYPFSFDIVMFLAIVLLPFIVFFLISIFKRK